MTGRAVFVTTIHAGTLYVYGNTRLCNVCVVVMFTILIHGGLTAPLLRWTKLAGVSAPPPPAPSKKKGKVHGFWSRLDKQYIIPFISFPRNVYHKSEEPHLGEEEGEHVILEDRQDGAEYHLGDNSLQPEEPENYEDDQFNNGILDDEKPEPGQLVDM